MMLRDQNFLNSALQTTVFDEISKVFCLNESEVVELEMPLIVDITRILSNKIIVTTRSLYPMSKFVNLDLIITGIRYSLIGKIQSFRVIEGRLYEITILLDDIPETLLSEIEAFYIEK